MYYIDRDGGFIYDVAVGTTVSQVVKNFKNTDIVTVSDKNCNDKADDACVATGYKVTYGDTTFDVIVKGDITGDGLLSSADAVEYSGYLRASTVLEGAFLLAGDIDYDGVLGSNDYLLIKKHMKGAFDIYSLKHP